MDVGEITLFAKAMPKSICFRDWNGGKRIRYNLHYTCLSGIVDLVLYDVLGNQIRMIQNINDQEITINRENLPVGMYVYHIENQAGKVFSGKSLVQ